MILFRYESVSILVIFVVGYYGTRQDYASFRLRHKHRKSLRIHLYGRSPAHIGKKLSNMLTNSYP